MKKSASFLLVLLFLTSCLERGDDVYASWMGKWNGPEGTYLDLSRRDKAYAVVIANLDGPMTFDGNAGKDGITFEREGKIETLRPGTGANTGMKWLADKKDCLVITPGEGFCRD